MKIKIVNKRKFMKLPIIILGLIFISIIGLTNNSSSNTKMTHKIIYVSQGETLWDIASKESKENKYFKGSDIREIVQLIKETNQLSNANISIGDELRIPTF